MAGTQSFVWGGKVKTLCDLPGKENFKVTPKGTIATILEKFEGPFSPGQELKGSAGDRYTVPEDAGWIQQQLLIEVLFDTCTWDALVVGRACLEPVDLQGPAAQESLSEPAQPENTVATGTVTDKSAENNQVTSVGEQALVPDPTSPAPVQVEYAEGYGKDWAEAHCAETGTTHYKLYIEARKHFSDKGVETEFSHSKPKYQAMVDLAREDVRNGNFNRCKRSPYKRAHDPADATDDSKDVSGKRSRQESPTTTLSLVPTMTPAPCASPLEMLKKELSKKTGSCNKTEKQIEEYENKEKTLKKSLKTTELHLNEAKANVSSWKAVKQTKDNRKRLADATHTVTALELKKKEDNAELKALPGKLKELRQKLKGDEKEVKRLEGAVQDEEIRRKELDDQKQAEQEQSDDSDSDDENDDAVTTFYQKLSTDGTTDTDVTQSHFIDAALKNAEIAEHFKLQIVEGATRQDLQQPGNAVLGDITKIFHEISSRDDKNFSFSEFKKWKFAVKQRK